MKFGTDVDWYLLRMCVERHCHATRIARDIGDRRCAAEATLRVSGDFFRFRSLADTEDGKLKI
jgi:hypothetical protein